MLQTTRHCCDIRSLCRVTSLTTQVELTVLGSFMGLGAPLVWKPGLPFVSLNVKSSQHRDPADRQRDGSGSNTSVTSGSFMLG